MKNCAIKLIIAACLVLTGISCKKFLDTKPQDSLTPVNYYQTEAQLNAALAGVYDILGSANVYGTDWWYRLGVSTDESFFRNPTNVDIRTLIASGSDATITNTWNALYKGINRSNTLLDALGGSPVENGIKSRIKAEARFLRAYYYYLLVSTWGGVPLRLKGTTVVEDNLVPRSTIKEVYDQVLLDMEEAVPDLATITSLGPNGSGRISRTAAQGILARVCLTMAGSPLKETARYADAKKWAYEVMKSGEHALNPNYPQIFINHSQELYDVRESMWEAEMSYDPSLAYTEFGSLGYLNSIKSENLDSGYCTALIAPTKKLWDLYTGQTDVNGKPDTNDLRRDWNIAPFAYVGDDPVNGKVYHSSTQIYQRYAGKWRRTYETGPKQKFYTYINFPILRFADVLLMYAEAENEINGPTPEAQDAVNKVRRRGWGLLMGNRVKDIQITDGGTGYTAAPVVTISGGGGSGAEAVAQMEAGSVTGIRITSQGNGYTSAPVITFSGGDGSGAAANAVITRLEDADLADIHTASPDAFWYAIQDERARELCFEGLRTADLKRWDIYISSLKAVANDFTLHGGSFKYGANAGNNIGTRNLLLPIPVSELTINRAMTQNPGY